VQNFIIQNAGTETSRFTHLTRNFLLGTSTDTGHKLTVSGSGTSGSVNLDNTLYVSGSNVGIGTSTQAYTLAVGGKLRVSAYAYWVDSGANALQVDGISSFSDAIILASGKQLQFGSSVTQIVGTSAGPMSFRAGSGNNQMSLFSTGNLLIQTGGTHTDAGYKLDVNGNVRIKGTGTTSATTSFIVQNSTGSSALTILDDKSAQFGGDVRTNLLTNYYSGNEFYISSQGSNSRINLQSLGNYSDYSIKLSTYYNQSTTGSYNHVVIDGGGDTFYSTGSSVNNLLVISPKINAQGGTNIYRGLYINPAKFNNPQYTDYRAIETVTGNVLLGTTSGNVGIGTTTLNASLDIRGTQIATGSIARTMLISSSLSASANSDVLVGLDINPTFITGSFTSVQNIGLRVSSNINTSGQYTNISTSNFSTAPMALRTIGTDNTGISIYKATFAHNNSIQFLSNNINNRFSIGQGYIGVSDSIDFNIGRYASSAWSNAFTIFNATGNISINSATDAGYKLDVNGTARVVGATTLGGGITMNTGGAVAQILVTGYTCTFRLTATSGIGNFDFAKYNGYAQIQSINEPIRYGSPSHLFGGTTLNYSALINMESTTQGFLPPRMTGAQAELISSPAEGLMVYATSGTGVTITSKGWWGFDGATWVKFN
jgi:hypothetical protein